MHTTTKPKCSRVLLVEDDSRLRSVLARSIGKLGHQVLEVGTAAAAHNILENNNIQAAVIDVNLPDGTGWEIVHWVRAHCESMPKLIVISGASLPASRIRALNPDATLKKPFPIDALVQHLERFVTDATSDPGDELR